jgi:phosphosulfolactate phosphohydrolase-like enzyme
MNITSMLLNLSSKGIEEFWDYFYSISYPFLYQRFEANLLGAFHLSRHGKEMVDLGAGDDLLYCTQTDITPLVPIFRDGVISLF